MSARDPGLAPCGQFSRLQRKLFLLPPRTFATQRAFLPIHAPTPEGAHTDIASSEKARRMDDLCRYSGRPFAFIFRYVRRRALSHGVIGTAVLAAVGCSITTQYGVKYLVDTLSSADRGNGVWFAFAFLVSLIAADNLFWRIAGFTMSSAFVRVTGDLRRDLFRHLTGHSPTYFANRMPGMLTARVTAT